MRVMRFGYVCQLKILAVLMLTLLTASCVKSPRKRAQPECAYGKNTDGSCRGAPYQLSAICEGNFGIKESGTSCVFHTAAHPNGCQVSGLHAIKGERTSGCLVMDSDSEHCQLDGLDRSAMRCNPDATIACSDAAVSLYLEVQQEGFKPHIVFAPEEKVKEGAELTLDEQRYYVENSEDITVGEIDSGKKTLTMPLRIPWRLTYTKEDGTEKTVKGLLNGSNVSKENASRGRDCPI